MRSRIHYIDKIIDNEVAPYRDVTYTAPVVAGWHEGAAAAPAARVFDVEGEVVGKFRRRCIFEERLDESLRLASGNHAAAAR